MIPLSVPNLNGNELKYVEECVKTNWVSSAGKFVEKFEEEVANYTGSKYAIACVNGTSALQVSLRLAGVKPGDEVLVPSLTFIAPINSIFYNNSYPLFMDSDRFYNIDVEKTIDFLHRYTFTRKGKTFNKKTKRRISAIVPVHVWGNAVCFETLKPVCQEMNIAIVEDASEGLGTFYTEGNYNRKHAGSIGELGCLSFNGNKIITTGGGGMILTEKQTLAEKAKYLTTQAKDDPVNYVHNEIGYNFRLTNVQSAIGVAQLEQIDQILEKKVAIYKFYQDNISQIEGMSIADVPEYSSNNHWLNILQIDTNIYGISVESVMEKLESQGIQTRPVWHLNHLQKPYEDCQFYKIENAINLVNQSLCLPSSVNLSNSDLTRIIKSLESIK